MKEKSREGFKVGGATILRRGEVGKSPKLLPPQIGHFNLYCPMLPMPLGSVDAIKRSLGRWCRPRAPHRGSSRKSPGQREVRPGRDGHGGDETGGNDGDIGQASLRRRETPRASGCPMARKRARRKAQNRLTQALRPRKGTRAREQAARAGRPSPRQSHSVAGQEPADGRKRHADQ